MRCKTKTWLVIPDCHIPYHSVPAWQLMVRAARAIKPHGIVVLGDFVDCYPISFHAKDPARKLRLADEIAHANQCLDELDALGAEQREYVMGNHEHRLERYIADKAPELHGVVPSIPQMLRLKRRGWNVTGYRDYVKIGRVHFTHDEGNAGPNAHVKARETFEGCVVIGHTHRLASTYIGNLRGDARVGVTAGCLLDFDSVDYLHKAKVRWWQHGFVVGHQEPSGVMHLQLCPIIKGLVCVDGVVYS